MPALTIRDVQSAVLEARAEWKKLKKELDAEFYGPQIALQLAAIMQNIPDEVLSQTQEKDLDNIQKLLTRYGG